MERRQVAAGVSKVEITSRRVSPIHFLDVGLSSWASLDFLPLAPGGCPTTETAIEKALFDFDKSVNKEADKTGTRRRFKDTYINLDVVTVEIES
jgi:hypothetical protein